jgi:hypothetical protein
LQLLWRTFVGVDDPLTPKRVRYPGRNWPAAASNEADRPGIGHVGGTCAVETHRLNLRREAAHHRPG